MLSFRVVVTSPWHAVEVVAPASRMYADYMVDLNELADRIRKILEHEMPGDPERVERTIGRILEIVDPFEKAAREELEHFRSTFTELAR